MGFTSEKKAPSVYSATTVSSEGKVEGQVDLYAERPDQGSNMSAYFNIICVIAGTGALSLPNALAVGGWIGVGILVLSMLMSIYTGMLIIRCIYYNGHSRLASYQAIGQHAFGKVGLWTVWFFHSSIILGVSVMYFILSGTEIQTMVKDKVGLSDTAWIWICCSVVSIPFVLMKTLKEVSLLSIFGVLTTVVMVGVAGVESIKDYNNKKGSFSNYDVVIARNLPMVLATMSVSFGGNVIFCHVEEAMRHPRAWNRVLIAAMSTCCIMYLLVAIPGYITYGPNAKSPILHSLPDGISLKVATIMIICHVLLAAPVLMTSFALEVERVLGVTIEKMGRVRERIFRTVIRLVIMGIVGGIASLVPYFDSFLSLLGAFGNCMLIYVMPIAFYMKLFGWRSMKWYELIWCAVILVIGLLSCVIGSIDAIKGLKARFDADR
ncbi:hypothetical protein BGZ93_006956 [Podila epicladia]|nr:hypothetical protein BGZ92_008393 [Podila epicladia]KAG0099567.1 hypothetical protein BGZ93_006956 [Podila epicladia]